MRSLLERYKTWLEMEFKAKNDRDRKIAKDQLNKIEIKIENELEKIEMLKNKNNEVKMETQDKFELDLTKNYYHKQNSDSVTFVINVTRF